MWAKVWPICVVLAVQVGLLAVVPARHVRARMSGTAITLKTRPLDPYDLMSGYHVILRYEVEDRAERELGGGQGNQLKARDRVWITIRRAEPAWEYVKVTLDKPDTASDKDTVAVPAEWEYGAVRILGATRLYVPETQRWDAERVSGSAFVDARVGSDGTVALLRLRIGDRTFGD